MTQQKNKSYNKKIKAKALGDYLCCTHKNDVLYSVGNCVFAIILINRYNSPKLIN